MPKRERSLIYQTTLQIIACSLLVGLLAIVITSYRTSAEAHKLAEERLNGLVSAIESTASIACFTADEALAREVAGGLMKDAAIRSVRIEAFTPTSPAAIKIAELHRAHSTTHESPTLPVVRQVFSPFFDDSGHPVGVITVHYEEEVIKQFVDKAVRHVAFELGLMLLVITVSMLYVMLNWVVRPVRRISHQLHRLNVVAGERLNPRNAKSREIDQLSTDINALADNLVASLSQEHELRLQASENEARFRAIFDHAETGLFVIESNGLISSYNRAFEHLLQPIPGKAMTLAQFAWAQPEQLAELVKQCFSRQKHNSLDTTLHVEGQIRHVHITLAWVSENIAQGVAYDITEAKEAEAAALRQALSDPLTGVLNRHGLEEALLHQRNNRGVPFEYALLAIDLIGFRKINEALGMLIGNDVLKTAALRISRSIKSSDLLARTSDDKFIVILCEPKTPDGALSAAERIRSNLGLPYGTESTPISIGAAIGISCSPVNGNEMPELIRMAELAMRHSKTRGGKECLFFNREMAEQVEFRRTLEVDIDKAIAAHELQAYYQPIVCVETGVILGAEALIRWQHPSRGMVPPDQFIPVAEETGQIIPIGLWMLDEVARQISVWEAAGHKHYVSINISGRQIPDGLSPKHLEAVIHRHGIAPDSLVLEITEGILLSDVEQARNWLEAIRDIGIRVYLDDFGTGYSSLSYLKRFQLDSVKIDRSFIRDLTNNTSDQALVWAIVGMAHSLSMQVVAEGVEEAAQLQLLHSMGCECAQGYLFSKPIPAAAFTELLGKKLISG